MDPRKKCFSVTNEFYCGHGWNIRSKLQLGYCYFWAEDDATPIGPFGNIERARRACEEYYNYLINKEQQMSISKDRVRFQLLYYYFEKTSLYPLLKEAFGVNVETYSTLREQAQTHGQAEIICRPSQFARFLIKREAAGFQNMFKELKAELFVPAPAPYVVDVSRNPA